MMTHVHCQRFGYRMEEQSAELFEHDLETVRSAHSPTILAWKGAFGRAGIESANTPAICRT